MKNTARVFFLTIAMIWLAGAGFLQAQPPVVTIGMLPVQDESGTQVPEKLLTKIGQELKQKLTMTYQDLLVRPVKGVSELSDTGVEQLTAMAKQQGLRYLVRPGVLGLLSERGGQELKCDIGLYAELIASDSGTVTSLRANGSGSETNATLDDARTWEAYDFKAKAFTQSALGQALNAAMEQLAQQLHQAIAPSGQTSESVPPETQPQPAPGEQGTLSPEADQELQQLIAQAESLVASGISSNRDMGSLQQALEGLRNALNSKVSLMTQGQDTATVDQEIARCRSELQVIVSRSTQEAALQPSPGEPQPIGGELSSTIIRVNELLGETLNCILKIQEIRTAVQSFQQDQASPSPNAADQAYTPMEEPTSDISGIVADDSGNPVEGATVIDSQSGSSATTDSSGSYTIPRIPSNRFATIQVFKGGKELSAGKVQLQPSRTALADWKIGGGGTGVKTAGIKILPATVIIAPHAARTARAGTIRGVVRDVKGEPVVRALVMIRGVGMARTDSQGSYLFANVPQGDYQVMVQRGGSAVQFQKVSVVGKKVVESATIYKGKAIAPPRPARKEVMARGDGAILKGKVSARNRQPLPRAKVTAIYPGGALSVLCGEKGRYEFRDLKQGSYRLLASRAGYQEASGNVTLKARQSEVHDFTLEKSSAEIQRVLSVRPATPAGRTGTTGRPTGVRSIAAEKGQICGVVRESRNGKPIENATVQVYGQQAVRTDRRGAYRIDNVLPGIYRVMARHGDYRQEETTVTVRSNATSTGNFSLKGKEGEESRGAMPPSLSPATDHGQVRGRISDSRSGEPVARATVTIGERKTHTSASGDYTLDKVPSGSATITVEKGDYRDGSRRITVRPGKALTVDFRLVPRSGSQLQRRLPTRIVPQEGGAK